MVGTGFSAHSPGPYMLASATLVPKLITTIGASLGMEVSSE